MKGIKRLVFNKWFLYSLAFAGLLVLVSNWRISFFSQAYLYDDVEKVPYNKVCLVLGTSEYLSQGGKNPYFSYRIDAAVELYENNKIDYIIVSGDNGTKHYNEPLKMKKALMKRGVSEKKIYLDYAGFRTLDSVVRAKEIFGQTKITIVSQKFHNQRAVYIAHKKGIEAIGYNAQDVGKRAGFKTRVREVFARVKVMLDLHLLNKQPHFLGEKIYIP